MNLRYTLLIIIATLTSAGLRAQEMAIEDSIPEVISIDETPECEVVMDNDTIANVACGKVCYQEEPRAEKFFQNRFVQATYIGIPLFAAGVIEMNENKHFRQLRNDFLPNTFKHEWENYAQYSPAAVMLALKACGVKSQSSWGKLFTAAASAGVIQFCTTHAIKRIAKEERPDGSTKNSFPSGHTATAFMTATMLAKEYGYISPWISIGGYTVATATGVMRMINNRHWMSDVLAGAGIGIMSAEFGYWIADALFKNSKKSYDPSALAICDPDHNPSFFGVYAGFYAPIMNHKLSEEIRSSTGGTAGFEGAYFWNNHWGVGGQVGVSDINYITNNTAKEVVGSMHFYTSQAGAYFSVPICHRLNLGAKAIAGTAFFPTQNEEFITNYRKIGFCSTAGISLGMRAHQHFDLKIGCDYGTFQSHNKDEDGFFHTIILSSTAMIRF